MPVRRTFLAASVLAVALAFVSVVGASAKKPQPPPGDTGPTNLKLTVNGPNSITLAWDAAKTSASNWWF